jgi:hypothetical protein
MLGGQCKRGLGLWLVRVLCVGLSTNSPTSGALIVATMNSSCMRGVIGVLAGVGTGPGSLVAFVALSRYHIKVINNLESES